MRLRTSNHLRLTVLIHKETFMQRSRRFQTRGNPPKVRRLVKFVGELTATVLLAAAAVATWGCDSGSFVPPQPEELRVGGAGGAEPATASRDVAPTAAKSVELILDRREAEESDMLNAAARTQAGIDKAKLKISTLGDQDLPAQQSELVREALTRRPLVLIIEPADPADRRMAQVVREAQGQGVPVVLVNRGLAGAQSAESSLAETKDGKPDASSARESAQQTAAPSPQPKAPVVVVTAPPFLPSARQLVASAIRNADNAQLKPEGAAVILVDTIGDSFVEERVEAIRAALKAAGISSVEQIPFAKKIEEGASLLTAWLQAHPKVVLAFSVDTLSSMAVRQVSSAIGETRPFIVAGYASEPSVFEQTRVGAFAAVAEFAPLRIVRRAITAGVELAAGKKVPPRVEQPVVVHDSPPTIGLPRAQGYYKKKEASKEEASQNEASKKEASKKD
jgi:ABC-type sugar transport system substrate-binding protein